MTIGYFLTYAMVAIVAGFFLMAPVAFVFDRMHWPVFNAWELARLLSARVARSHVGQISARRLAGGAAPQMDAW